MAVTFTPYTRGMKHLMLGDVNLSTDTLRVTLHKATYTPNLDTHEFWTDLAGEFTTGGGYTVGGLALTNQVVGHDGTGHFAYLDADDWVINPLTLNNIRYAVLWQDTGTPATSVLLGLLDFVDEQFAQAEEFRLAWAAPDGGGILELGV